MGPLCLAQFSSSMDCKSLRLSYNYYWKATYQIEHGVLHGDLLEYHLVLGEGAGLISQQVLYPAELLGYGGVPGYGPRYLSISVDAVGVVDLGHVQVDAEGDRDDVGEEEHEAEELDDPLTLELVQGYH